MMKSSLLYGSAIQSTINHNQSTGGRVTRRSAKSVEQQKLHVLAQDDLLAVLKDATHVLRVHRRGRVEEEGAAPVAAPAVEQVHQEELHLAHRQRVAPELRKVAPEVRPGQLLCNAPASQSWKSETQRKGYPSTGPSCSERE